MFKKFVSTCLIACTALTLLPVQNAFAKSSPEPSVDDAIDWAVATAADDSHGYSQSKRLGNPDYDCSSFTASAFKAAGFDIGSVSEINTRTMRAKFVKAGFTWIPASQIDLSSSEDLEEGDILLAEGSHAEIYIGDNQRVGAHRDYDGKSGDSTGKEISVTKYANFGCNGVLRWTSAKTSSEEEEKLDVDLSLSQLKKTKSSITVEWDKTEGISGYELSYSDSRTGAYTTIDLDADTTSFKVKGLDAGTQYYFKLRAYKTEGDSTIYSANTDVLTGNTSGVVKKKATVTAKSSLVLRQYAGTDASKITSIKKDETVTISYVTKDSTGRTWYKASYKDGSKTYNGYVVADYISIK